MSQLTTTTVTVAAAAAAAASLYCWYRRRSWRTRLVWMSRLRSRYWLTHVRIPVATLPPVKKCDDDESRKEEHSTDAEGLVECHVCVAAGEIAEIVIVDDDEKDAPATTRFERMMTMTPVLNARGRILMPRWRDAHTHLTKTLVTPSRVVNVTGTMTEALRVEAETVEPRCSTDVDDVLRRMEFALRCALHHGTRVVRTHLDGCASDDPRVRDVVYEAYDALRYKYRDDVVLQGVANLWLPRWLEDEDFAASHADRAATHGGVVLGAYVGKPDDHDDTVRAFSALLKHAHRLRLDVDLHIDESDDPDCCALAPFCEALAAARAGFGYAGRVVLGHACALSLQPTDRRIAICRDLAALRPLTVVVNPFTNLGLQDRRRADDDDDDVPPRTPQWRGLTAVHELRAAGVPVAAATDNVRDHWYPYGDYDVLSVWSTFIQMGHLDTAPTAGHWADACTVAPARALGTTLNDDDDDGGLLAPGRPADVIVFPSARCLAELLARPQTDRLVLRRGRVMEYPLPDYDDLDDLTAA